MRFFIVLLLVAATTGIRAQELLFDKTIPEQNVPEASRLKNEMRSHYISSRYVSQSDFLSQKDFFIAINANLIVKSRFIKIYSYPNGSFSYEGRLEGTIKGSVTFSKYNDRTAGLILLDDGSKYMIDQVASNIFAISLSNEFVFISKENRADFIEVSGQDQPNASVASICDAGSVCSGPSTIDILVVYTPQAENNWGGASSTIANITQAITNMNASMSGSGINNVMFRLVHTAKIIYSESGNFSTDLTRLAGSADGYMDNVHSLRDQYGADLVSMIIGSPTSSCGIGYLNTNPSAYSSGNAFNVSLYSCVVGNFTIAHESGHNMGLRHDWYVDATTTPCSQNHGYVNEVALAQGTSSAASARWRTIMAYNDRCAVAGFNCTRINKWSNPNLSYNGDAMGSAIGNIEPSDEAYAFYRMACVVAAFRPAAGSEEVADECSSPSGLFTSSITTSSSTANWSPVSGATGYDVDYKASASGFWINIASGTNSTSWDLLGMPSSTSFDWRVRANCSSGSSAYVQTSFSTLSLGASCSAPSGLASLNITSSSATASWSPVSGANSYDVDYKASSSGSWINIASGITSTSWGLAAMPSSTSFDWRVRANCSSGSSAYVQTSFSTLSLGASCSAPSGLASLNITSSSATASWNAVSGANSYDVDYKASSSGSWINIASGTTSLSWNLLGMPSSTSFDWRVRANCSSGSSAYVQTSFSTLSLGASCSAPSGLASLNITSSSATASWSPVSGANSYDVDYKASSSGSWINIASGITSTSWGLAAMPSSTSFDWRVRANCSSGSSAYVQTSFSTLSLGASCSAPSGLASLNITSSSATASWNAVSGATSYDVDYKASSSGSWINIASGTTSLSWNLLGMPPSTSFDWRVRANCSSGSSAYVQTSFSTLSLGASCSAPSGLASLNITSSSATASWSPVSGANSYDVDYKASSSGSWINIASGITSTSWGLAAMPSSTSFDWRVRANCSSGSSAYVQTSFSTLSLGASCSAPSGLASLNITSSSATASWSAVSGANSYDVDYKASSSGSWINIASGTTSLSWNLLGMPSSTSFDWRVRANCSSGSSAYVQTSFSTLSLGASCSAPSGLASLNITSSSATASWSPVSGANSYDVDYKASSSGSWINIASGITSTSWGLAAMPSSTSFDWRVRANCSSGSSAYVQTSFSTLSLGASCSAPSGLASLNITSSSATASWNAVSGATSYDVDYKASSSGSWINLASGTTSLSWNLLGIPSSTSFDWRVRANCASGSSAYVQTSFSTLSLTTSCSAPTGLSTSGITATAATSSWAPVSGAASYNVDYKLASSSNWITIANGTTSLQWTLSGMQATTSYDWRVRANCTSGMSSYTQTQFTTLATGSCSPPGGLFASNIASSTATLNWNAVNGAFAYTVQYKPVSSGTWIFATSGTYGLFVNLYSLSANTTYDWRVYSNCSLTEASTYSYGQFTTSGSRTPPGTATDQFVNPKFTINLFPNPVNSSLNVWIEGVDQKAQIKVYDLMGKLVIQQTSTATLSHVNVSKLPAGIYILNVNNGKETRAAKFVKE